MTTNNAGWTRGWFYLRNDGERLPAFTNKVLRERPEKWNWGVSPSTHQARLEPLTNALQHLAKKELTVAAVHREFSSAESDSSRGEESADLRAYP